MSKHTSPEERRRFFELHQSGRTYQEIADELGVSQGCVRYWCRRQRDGGGCVTVYERPARGVLSQFHPKVRYAILRLRLEHPRWGPGPIRYHLSKRPSLRGLELPSPASIGRYLHQWPRFRRRPRRKVPARPRPDPPQNVHQRWQLDFKVRIELADGALVHLHTACDPVGGMCVGASVFQTGEHSRYQRVSLEQVQAFLRTCFGRWRTLPSEIQTDHETVLAGKPGEGTFPSRFTLWLKGLDIDHLTIRPGKPTDNAEVERCHRTINEYAIIGNEKVTPDQLQTILDNALDELLYQLPSRAKNCQGRPPAMAYPELFQPPRPFCPEHELARFDLQRVDQYLATFTWPRQVGTDGRVRLGTQRYFVGLAHARRHVLVRFDPTDRNFVFCYSEKPDHELRRLPAKCLGVEDLTGIALWPQGLGPQQPALPFFNIKGYVSSEQKGA